MHETRTTSGRHGWLESLTHARESREEQQQGSGDEVAHDAGMEVIRTRERFDPTTDGGKSLPAPPPGAMLDVMDALELLLAQTRHRHAAFTKATEVTLEQALWPQEGPDPSISVLLGHLREQTASTARALCGLEESAPPQVSIRDEEGWQGAHAAWKGLSDRFLGALEGLEPADLELPPLVEIEPAFRESLATRARFWSGHVFHVAYHLGQVGRLRARQGLDYPS